MQPIGNVDLLTAVLLGLACLATIVVGMVYFKINFFALILICFVLAWKFGDSPKRLG